MADLQGHGFDADTIALLKRVLLETEAMLPMTARSSEVRVTLASGILTAAAEGERDPVRLRSAGLQKISARITPFAASRID